MLYSYGAADCLYANGALCVIFPLSISVLYPNGESVYLYFYGASVCLYSSEASVC